MRVFLTGATGFIGTAVARELIGTGHAVLGVARTEQGARTLASRGVEPHMGDLTDHDSFISGARACDAVIQCAFIHDFSRFAENIEIEKNTVAAMLDALAGSRKPFIITSGVAMLAPGRTAAEDDRPQRQGRGETEALVREAAGRGLRTAVIRLPPITYDSGEGGFLPMLVAIAREKGVAAYIGDGANRWPAGHVLDIGHLYRLALEKASAGSQLYAAAEEGITVREIAETIGRHLNVPAVSIPAEQAADHFKAFPFMTLDITMSNADTRQLLDWEPVHPGLIADLEDGHYFTTD